MDSADLKNRTKNFAHRCVRLAVSLPQTRLGRHMQGQLIRCSTSVAANYRATCLAQTKAVFVSKISIVIEEADESAFWLEFTREEELLSDGKVTPLMDEAKELTSIFIASRKTAQKKLANSQ